MHLRQGEPTVCVVQHDYLSEVHLRLVQAGERLGLSEDLTTSLLAPRRVLEVSIPFRTDEGSIATAVGWRVQHNTTRGPGKGGVRFHPSVDRDETVALATQMSVKTALMKLPLGGAKGGVRIDPRSHSGGELERIARRYTSEILPLIGPDKDVPAPDVGTDAQTMAWMMDQYSVSVGYAVPGVVTGKPVALGGSLGRESATGRGVVQAALLAMGSRGDSLAGARVVVQGFGNVGSWVARLAQEAGAVVVGIADVSGAIWCDSGLDLGAVSLGVAQNGDVVSCGVGEVLGVGFLGQELLLTAQADVVFPCALSGAINADIARKMRCRYVVEGANGPTTPDADEILAGLGVVVVPDVYANSGGVVCSYLEQCQNFAHLYWSEDEVNDKVVRIMRGAWPQLEEMASRHQVSLRAAATMIGLATLAEARQLRGLHP